MKVICGKLLDHETGVIERVGWFSEDAEIIEYEGKRILKYIYKIHGKSDGEKRHAAWLHEIKSGGFSFGADNIEYIAKGEGSWKHTSIGQLAVKDSDGEEFTYAPDFLHSNWKLFHDALQAHRFDILHDVLTKYGICAA